MSDRWKGLTVTLEPGIREDEGKEIVAAIQLIRGVLAVVPALERGGDDAFVRTRVEIEWRRKILALLDASP